MKRFARITGAFYLLTIVFGVLGQSFQDRFLVAGDAAATAQRITAQPGLVWMGLAAFLVEMGCQTAMTALFYHLLKPASRPLSFLAACFGLVGIGIKTTSRLFFLAPLLVLGAGTGYLEVFSAAQRQALAFLMFNLNAQGTGMALVYFGVSAMLMGWLVLRSTFLPKVLGVLSLVGGAGWLAFLHRPLADRWYGVIVGAALVASVAKIFWLLAFGVNEAKWREQASG